MNTFEIWPHCVALAGAYALAFPIGWDREKKARSAGLRTFPLVAMASCSMVHGTSTAASLWATGAIGTSVGLGSYDVAAVIALFTFLTLKLLPLLKEDGEETEKLDRD